MEVGVNFKIGCTSNMLIDGLRGLMPSIDLVNPWTTDGQGVLFYKNFIVFDLVVYT